MFETPDGYDADEARAVLEQARRDYDALISDPPEEAPPKLQVRFLLALTAELLEITTSTLEEVEELRDALEGDS